MNGTRTIRSRVKQRERERGRDIDSIFTTQTSELVCSMKSRGKNRKQSPWNKTIPFESGNRKDNNNTNNKEIRNRI